MRLPILFLAAAFALAGSTAPSPTLLASDVGALVADFNARSDQLRFMAILSPT
jgi:hypothetical protein